jgi:hypothetical protein
VHLAIPHLEDAISELPNLWRVADKDDLVEASDRHGVPKHANVFSGILRIQGADRLVPKQRFVPDTLSLSHIVNRNAEVNGLIDQYELLWSAKCVRPQFKPSVTTVSGVSDPVVDVETGLSFQSVRRNFRSMAGYPQVYPA